MVIFPFFLLFFLLVSIMFILSCTFLECDKREIEREREREGQRKRNGQQIICKQEKDKGEKERRDWDR